MSKDHEANSQEARCKADARSAVGAHYDRLCRWYDWIAGSSERKAMQEGLDLLAASDGETILEIGYGTGRAIVSLARAVGASGHVDGIDISEGMRRVATQRIVRAGLQDRVDLHCLDAEALSFGAESFDAAFMSFTLELFEESKIPLLLKQCRRILKPGSRMVVVAMEKKVNANVMMKLYEWAHRTFPNAVDCRPIHAACALTDAGFRLIQPTETRMWGLPVSIVLARKPQGADLESGNTYPNSQD